MTEFGIRSLRVRAPSITMAGRCVAALAALCGLITVTRTLTLVATTWSDVPFYDQWGSVVSGRDVTWSWLFTPNNEHRIAVPRLVFMLDRWIGAERNLVDLAANMAIQAAIAVTFAWVASRGRGRWWRLGLLGFTTTVCFWSAQWENFTWGFQVQFLGVALGAMAVFALVLALPFTVLGFASIALAMAATTYTLASGIVAALLAPCLATAARRSPWQVASLTACAIVLAVAYTRGLPTVHEAAPHMPWSKYGPYFLTEVGGPFGWTGRPAASRVAGAAGLGLGAVTVFAAVLTDRSRSALFLIATGAFALGWMALTAYGRVQLGPESALGSRYATPCIMFWLSTVLLGLTLARWRRRFMTAALIIPAGMLACVLFTQGQYDRLAAAVSLNRELAVPALLSRVADTQFLQYATPNDAEALAVMDALQDARTSLYQRPLSRLLGRPLGAANLPLAAGHCGAVGGSDPVGSPPHDGRRFHGTLDVPASVLLLVGAGDTIVGYGAPSEVPGEWRGYARGPAEAVAQVYAATAGGLCPLAPAPTTAAGD